MVWGLGEVCLVGWVFFLLQNLSSLRKVFFKAELTLGNATIGRICWQWNHNEQNSAGNSFFREALSTTGQECYCSAVTVSSSTQTSAMFLKPFLLPRPSCQSHSHTQSRCQPTLTLPAATNRIWLSATDDAQEPLVKLPVELGRHSHPSSSMEPVSAQWSCESCSLSGFNSWTPCWHHTDLCGLSTSSDTSSTTNFYFLHPSPSRMAHVLYKERCRTKAISRVLSKPGKRSFQP